jgi:hypothetical protein
MTNVLPQEILQVGRRRFNSRFLLVGALVFLGTAALSALALLPSHVALQSGYTNQGQQDAVTVVVTRVANDQQTSDRNDVIRAQTLLLNVQSFVSATISPTDAITTALSLRPKNVLIDRISFMTGGEGTITISGSSQARESISKYRDALAGSGRFKSATVPVSALVGTEGGKFTITLSGIL